MPSPARLYDFYLGGRHNFPADRMAAQRIITALPDLPDAAWANRSFHQRAARWLAEQGIRQFIDIGSGLPTVGNTHEIVQAVAPDARVVYVDNDPMVALFSSSCSRTPRPPRSSRPTCATPRRCSATRSCAR